MSQNLVRATAAQPGRTSTIHPGNSSMLHISYGRIRLDASLSTVSFVNAGQETGLICVQGHCTIDIDGQSYSLGANDSLYVPKDHPVVVRTDAVVDLVECSAPVDGDYP